MERRKPLRAKKGLQAKKKLQSNKRLAQQKGLSQNKPLQAKKSLTAKAKLTASKGINQRSKKTEQIYVERRKLVADLLSRRPHCEACHLYQVFDFTNLGQVNDSSEVHEIVLRSQGGDILDESICVVVCRKCHARIDEDRDVAMLLGLYVPGFAYNPECIQEARYLRLAVLARGPFVPSYMR
jgi:DNA-binding transcriptional MocR family regulator